MPIPGPRPLDSWDYARRRSFFVHEIASLLHVSPWRISLAMDRHPQGTRANRPVNALADAASLLSAAWEVREVLGPDTLQDFWEVPRSRSHTPYWASRWEKRLAALSSKHSWRADVLHGRISATAAALLTLLDDDSTRLTPGALYDPNSSSTIHLSIRLCHTPEEEEAFRSLQVGDLGWVDLDPGTRCQFVIRRLDAERGEGDLTGVDLSPQSLDAWSDEWDWAKAHCPETTKDLGDDGPHLFSLHLMRGECFTELLFSRFLALPFLLWDGLVYLRSQQATAMSGTLSGPFAQWWWLRPFAPCLTSRSRARRREISKNINFSYSSGFSPSKSPLSIPRWLRSLS